MWWWDVEVSPVSCIIVPGGCVPKYDTVNMETVIGNAKRNRCCKQDAVSEVYQKCAYWTGGGGRHSSTVR